MAISSFRGTADTDYADFQTHLDPDSDCWAAKKDENDDGDGRNSFGTKLGSVRNHISILKHHEVCLYGSSDSATIYFWTT